MFTTLQAAYTQILRENIFINQNGKDDPDHELFLPNMQAKRKTGSGWKKEKYFHESKDWIKMYKTISDSNAPSM